jgi:Permease for cytosine/purines, uracil, thiamine, allantoin
MGNRDSWVSNETPYCYSILNTFIYRISPIPIEKRIDKCIYQMFTIWFSTTFNILSFSTGSSGPAFFSLSVRDSLLVILVVNLMCVFWNLEVVKLPLISNILYFSLFIEHASSRLTCAFWSFFLRKTKEPNSKNTSFPTSFRKFILLTLPSSAQFLDLNWECVQWSNVASPGGMCAKHFFIIVIYYCRES